MKAKNLAIKLISLHSNYKHYNAFLEKKFSLLKINYSKVTLPIRTKHLTLLKSPHVNKKAREQFILTKYKTVFLLKAIQHLDFLPLLLLNKPKSIKIRLKLKER